MTDLEQRDGEILKALESGFPIASTPFAIIGQMVDMSEKEVIKRVLRMRQSGTIRALQIRWDPRALGCTVALVIASVDEGKLPSAVEAINSHPCISQNYRRNHEFNLWLTLCLPSDSRLGLEGTVAAIKEIDGVYRAHALPALRLYRDGELELEAEIAESPEESDRRRIRVLQEELPIQPRPFDVLARRLNESPDRLLEFVMGEKERGTITRVGPVLAPSKDRFTTSAMGVWSAPEDRVDEIARLLSSDQAISSCTVRETRGDWPYNLFTIIQGRSVDECERTMRRLAEPAGISNFQTLFPLHEYKQTRMTLFPPELAEWEEGHLGSSASRTAAS